MAEDRPATPRRNDSDLAEPGLETDASDDESSPALREPADSIELRRVGASWDRAGSRKSPTTSEPCSHEDESENENRRPITTRIGSTSKEFSTEEEKKIVRKFDRRLVLFLALLYMLSFLDRSNIGNARIAGLDESLSLSSSQYDWLLTVFYITYISFEWMTLLYKIIPAHIFISFCVLLWGLVASLQSLSTSFTSLAILRGVLGVAEAGFVGIPFYLTFFYKRSELAYRVGLFIAAAPLATSFAATLAWVIVKLSRNSPIEPWRALFLAEGFPSVIISLVAFYQIPDSPATTRYLSAREKRVAKLRLRPDATIAPESNRGIHAKEIFKTLRDPKAYLTALMFFSANVAFSSLPVFLPTIIHDMAFSSLASQALSAPPFLCSFVFVLITAHICDKTPDSRSWFIAGVSLLSATSYAAISLAGVTHEGLGEAGTITIRYIGVYGAAMGFFSAVTLIITWTLNNQRSDTGKGTGMTILQVIGQCGPLVGTRLFPKSHAPYYIPGMAVCAGFMFFVAVLAVGLRWHLSRLNRSQDVAEYEMVDGAGEGLVGHGRKASSGPNFRFML